MFRAFAVLQTDYSAHVSLPDAYCKVTAFFLHLCRWQANAPLTYLYIDNKRRTLLLQKDNTRRKL